MLSLRRTRPRTLYWWCTVLCLWTELLRPLVNNQRSTDVLMMQMLGVGQIVVLLGIKQ